MNSETETFNEDLEKLAAQAEAEEKQEREQEEQEAAGEVVDYDEKEAARRAAESIVSGMAAGARIALNVEYPEEVRQEGVDKLAPCLEGGVMPSWMAGLLGKYGKYIDAGCWFGGVAWGTYRTIQQRKEEEAEKEQKARDPITASVPVPVGQPVHNPGEGFGTGGI